MDRIKPRFASIALMTAGLAAGLLIAGGRSATLKAGGGSRSGASSTVAGPIKVEAGPSFRFGMPKLQAPIDAVYWIDYKGARLYAAIPSAHKTANDVSLLREFAERDLIADFGLKPGVDPRFLMNTASLGAMGGGTSLLLVIETTTGQVAAYRASAKASSLESRPEFERLQLAPYGQGQPPSDPRRGEPIGVSGPMIVEQAADGTQSPLDVVYWLDGDSDRTPRLRAVIPAVVRTAGEARAISEVGERDLAADFRLKPGTAPRFLLNVVSLGASVQGASALVVIETTTKQVAAYQVAPRATPGAPARAELLLTQIKPFVEAAPPSLPAAN